MTKREFYYPSSDGKTKIHAIRWEPEGEPVGIVQIVHGMAEFVDRYDEFAKYLAGLGCLVAGEDHLGHGESVVSVEYRGYFGEKGNECIITDIHHLRKMMNEEFPDAKYILLGHSMGSFLVRQYITENDCEYAKGLSGAVLLGSGWTPKPALSVGMAIAKVLGLNKVGKPAPILDLLSFGSSLKMIPKPRTRFDWLTKEADVVDRYLADPRNAVRFTPNAYYHMYGGMKKAHDTKRMKKLPKGLPILFASGAEDPVGSWGKGVEKAFRIYTENTDCRVTKKLYPGCRHEILNETEKDEVFEDLRQYFEHCLGIMDDIS